MEFNLNPSILTTCMKNWMWKRGNPPDTMRFWQSIKKLNVETWNSTGNHEFWVDAQKIGCGNVEDPSNPIIIDGLSLKMGVETWKVHPTLCIEWQLLCLNLPVETWKTHSTLLEWEQAASKKFDNTCVKLNVETWKSRWSHEILTIYVKS